VEIDKERHGGAENNEKVEVQEENKTKTKYVGWNLRGKGPTRNDASKTHGPNPRTRGRHTLDQKKY